MAGNIVKWWRQFKQYKQFSVLQECATDSEDLIYPARAASTCSAPPDLLLTSNESKNLTTSISSTQSSAAETSGSACNKQQQPQQRVVNKETQQSISEAEAQLNHHQSQESQDGRVRLEEFTCDVSVDDGKKPQPIQFSFTLYDLDGHGKITKDDIAGIVSTIYDSIGKTVVVPHYGKKTINVRLTVSPDSKKQSAPTTSTTTTKLTTSATKKLPLTSRRRSYRPRKLLSDESENDDDLDDSESSATSDNLVVVSDKQQQQQQQNNNEVNNKLNTSQTPLIVIDNNSNLCNKNSEIFKTNNKNTVYESINNLKCSNQLENLVLLKATNNNNNENVVEMCKNCTPDEKLMKKVHHQHHQHQSPSQTNGVNYTIKHHKQIPSSKKKVLRKSRSRKQKPSEIPTARVRSLSVGNENKWKFAHHANNLLNEQQRQHNDALLKQQKQFLSAKEYQWNNIDMRKQELIEIIRDSMEKNRLCFQSNRKSREMPSNSSRLRSNTISKMTHVSEADQTHLCAFDSFLHATICSNLHNNNNISSNSNNNTPNKHSSGKQSNNKSKIPSKQNVKLQSNIPCQQLKLKTSILNQINPNLTAEQKLSRKLNDVEKWLFERESQNNISCYPTENVVDSGRMQKDQDKNILNSSLTNKLKTSVETSSPKKVFNKEILITKKGKSMQQQQQQKNVNKNQLILEYSNVPVNVDASECENLISISDDEIPTGSAPTVVEKPEKETVENEGSSTSKSSQSTVHRYVHEHIHLHYHYLKNEHDE